MSSRSGEEKDSNISRKLSFSGKDEEWFEWSFKIEIIGIERKWWDVVGTDPGRLDPTSTDADMVALVKKNNKAL